jgi:hypothetical protein
MLHMLSVFLLRFVFVLLFVPSSLLVAGLTALEKDQGEADLVEAPPVALGNHVFGGLELGAFARQQLGLQASAFGKMDRASSMLPE